jgi:DNA polymerase III subunit beta
MGIKSATATTARKRNRKNSAAVVEAPSTAPATEATAPEPAVSAPALVSVPRHDEFTVSHADLKGALARITSVVDKRATLPILQRVAMRSRGGELEIVGTDLDVYLTIRLATGNGSAQCGTTFAAHKMSALVRTLPSGDIAIAPGTPTARIAAGRVTAKLEAIPDRDYPRIPTLGDLPWTSADARVWRSAIESVMFSVCQDQTRFHLAGAFMECDGSTLTMVTTDGHRLTKARRAWEWSGPSLASGILIPIKGLQELRKLLAGHDACQIGIAKPFLFVKAGNAELAIKLTDAQFPPYAQVIPTDYRRLVTVAAAPLRQALERAKLLTCETRGVRLEMGDGELTVASDNPDVGQVTESISANYKGPSARWGVNPVYLLQLLEQIDGDSITMSFKDELDPMLVRATDDAVMLPVMEAGFLGVIMPMRI